MRTKEFCINLPKPGDLRADKEYSEKKKKKKGIYIAKTDLSYPAPTGLSTG